MAIFEIKDKKVNRIKPTEFKLEKDLQKLVEKNLETFFNCRFVATELTKQKNYQNKREMLEILGDKKYALQHAI